MPIFRVIHIAHDKQLLAERLKRFEHIVKAFVLQRRGNAEAEEHVECAHRHLGLARQRVAVIISSSNGNPMLTVPSPTRGRGGSVIFHGLSSDGWV